MSFVFDAVIVGGGQAGLAMGFHLKRSGLRFAILEAGAQATGSWPMYYDSLKLFSPAHYSSLPGMPFPGDPDHYPHRDEVVDYLIRYARAFELPVQLNTRVERVARDRNHFRLFTAGGDSLLSWAVIAATGSFHRPHIPQLPGQKAYQGRLLHSREYTNPEGFAGKRVIVVGAGNSAVQIAVEMAETAAVTLATREPIKFVPQRFLGRDVHVWLRLSGFDTLPLGRWIALGKSGGVLDTGVYRAALAAGKPDRRPMFTGFVQDGVIWSDGSAERVDAVVFATGYLPNLGFLDGLGALDQAGAPLHRGGVGVVPGLYYVGLSGQRSHASATLRGVGGDAAHAASHLRCYLRKVKGGR